MLGFVLNKIASLPWYFWFLGCSWGAIETAGWLRARNGRKTRRLGVNRAGRFSAHFLNWGLRRRV